MEQNFDDINVKPIEKIRVDVVWVSYPSPKKKNEDDPDPEEHNVEFQIIVYDS